MSGLREQIKQLAEQRDAVEAEVNFISARLDATGVGMTGRLIDSEGFPRADLDIPAIRADRHRMAGKLVSSSDLVSCVVLQQRDVLQY